VLTPADDEHHIWKHDFKSPFVCGARNLGEALRRIAEGAAMIRTKGEAGSGNIVEAVRHLRSVCGEMRALTATRARGAAGAREGAAGAARPRALRRRARAAPGAELRGRRRGDTRDAALCRALGAEAVFVGSGIFKSADPAQRARAVVRACTHWDDAKEVLEASRGLGKAMDGIEMSTLSESERLANRGW
jgi:pyridoxal 5'-phosphate synthase pdxS subunit